MRWSTHPGIDVISLTGGPAAGRAVMAAAAPRLTPLLLELGGNDAAIIAPDITISDQLVEQLVTATYTTGGQVCMAIKRLYAPRDRVDELAEAVLARCEREVVGDGLAAEVTLGPLHTAAGRDRVDVARQRCCGTRGDGAHRGTDPRGGRRRGWVLRAADGRHRTWRRSRRWRREEQFGPVLPIFGYDAIDDAVAAANATEFGLTASVWTGDDALADKVTGQLVAGTVSVNCHGMAAQDPRVPFGGVGQSGLGPRARRRRDPGVHAAAGLRPPAGAAIALMVYGSTVFINITLYADHSDRYSHDRQQDGDNRRDLDVGVKTKPDDQGLASGHHAVEPLPAACRRCPRPRA